MNPLRDKLLASIIVLNILSIIFYFSPISLYGYWTDTIFLFLMIIISFILLKRVKTKLFKRLIKLFCTLNLFVLLFVSFSFSSGIIPVHFISKGEFEDKNEYAYFIKRGNLGITNGCYGEIQYFKQLSWLPILEIKVETEKCSKLDFECFKNGC